MKKQISNIVDQALDTINDSIVKRTATESLARVAMHAKQQPNPSSAVYEPNGYNEQQYTTNTTGQADPIINQGPAYSHGHGHMQDNGNMTLPYSMATQIPVAQQSTAYDHQPFIKPDEERGLNSSHAAALAVSPNTTSQASANTYAYPQSLPQVTNSQQAGYVANNYSPQDWRQWTQTYMQQPVGPSGEYLNTATTLMSLGGRDGSNSDNGHTDAHGQHIDQAHLGHFHWPNVAFPGAANGVPHHS